MQGLSFIWVLKRNQGFSVHCQLWTPISDLLTSHFRHLNTDLIQV